MSPQKGQFKKGSYNNHQPASRPAGSVSVKSRSKDPDDFFRFEGKEDNKHYHWPESDSRRIQQMKRDGYEVVPVKSSDEVAKKRSVQKEYLKRQINNQNTPEKDAVAAQELLNALNVAPLDTVTNIPGHIIMQTSQENWEKRQEMKQDKSKGMEEQIQQDVQDLDKALKRSGKGGMKAFKDLFDSINER